MVSWIKGYLHPDLTTIQGMGLKWSAKVDGDQPIIAEVDECTQQHLWEPQAVSAHGTKTSILAKGAGVVVHIHLQSPQKTKL
jgi:hypothetical protein